MPSSSARKRLPIGDRARRDRRPWLPQVHLQRGLRQCRQQHLAKTRHVGILALADRRPEPDRAIRRHHLDVHDLVLVENAEIRRLPGLIGQASHDRPRLRLQRRALEEDAPHLQGADPEPVPLGAGYALDIAPVGQHRKQADHGRLGQSGPLADLADCQFGIVQGERFQNVESPIERPDLVGCRALPASTPSVVDIPVPP